jgi:integrase
MARSYRLLASGTIVAAAVTIAGLVFSSWRLVLIGTIGLGMMALYDSAWRPALRGAGLAEDRFKFHSWRYFCASSLLADGAPITAVAGHLGDTVETISKVYLHWLRDDRSVPRVVLDRLLAEGDGAALAPSS